VNPIFLHDVFLQYARLIFRGILYRRVRIVSSLEIIVIETDVVHGVCGARVL
jgi:hypothetical protein